MDFPKAIDLNKTLLIRIIAGLYTLLGGAGKGLPLRISMELHRSIVRVLRPAESAVRRLIVVLVNISGVKAPPRAPNRVPSLRALAARAREKGRAKSVSLLRFSIPVRVSIVNVPRRIKSPP